MNKMIICLVFSQLCAWAGEVSADVSFTGNLLDRPCQLTPVSDSQDVTFFTTTVQQFNTEPARSPPATFKIELNNCRVSDMQKLIKISFSGEVESSLPGTLKVSGVNKGKLAIKILEPDGVTPVIINSSQVNGPGRLVDSNDITINYSAYTLTVPEALKNKSVEAGVYNAVAIFDIFYQ